MGREPATSPPVGCSETSAASFVNPYYVAPAVSTSVVYDYSQPVPIYVDAPSAYPDTIDNSTTIFVQQPVQTQDVPIASPVIPDAPQVVAADPQPQPPAQPEDPKVKEAGMRFDVARDQFKGGSYADAVASLDKGIKVLPNDTALHEFRALALFAQGKFSEATPVIYSVLAVGPGWSWDTVKSFYADWHTYEQQLNRLKAYVDANPKDAGSRFLLAYHMLVIDDRQQAVNLLNQVTTLNPEDQLAHAMSTAIAQSLTPATPATPGDARRRPARRRRRQHWHCRPEVVALIQEPFEFLRRCRRSSPEIGFRTAGIFVDSDRCASSWAI